MKFLFTFFISLFLFTFSFLSYASPPLTAKQIILKQKELNTGYHDEIAEGVLIMGSQKRECIFKQLEGTPTKSLIKIIKPADLQGMTLLNHQREGGGDQWLYLPSSQKIKRIAGQGSHGRFLGSEFTYEDLLPKNIHQYDYTLLSSEPCSLGSCYVIEAKTFFSSSAYSKTIIWVDQKTYQNRRIDFYDKKERLIKRSIFLNYQKFQGKFFRPLKIVMTNLVTQKQTELIIKKMEIGVGLKEGDFSRQALGR